ncbi:MAG: hypothetical protein HYV26_00745 [Candidatus Hydrogenedentes bacterium]|nr:hypothetical protein [Candidatus Hydrogenedentota bacterium]MBI3118379.1 hypothetical protein [Candidatus Hydrogenedentota bacterium]
MNVHRLEPADEAAKRELAQTPVQPLPLNLYRRVTRGVRFAACRQREALRFRRMILAWAFALVLLVSGAAAVVVLTNFPRVLRFGVSGGMGWFDYYSTALRVALSGYMGAYSLLAGIILTVGTVLLCLFPYGRSLKGQ